MPAVQLLMLIGLGFEIYSFGLVHFDTAWVTDTWRCITIVKLTSVQRELMTRFSSPAYATIYHQCCGGRGRLIDWARFNVPLKTYRSYRRRVFTGQMTQPTVSKHWTKGEGGAGQEVVSTKPHLDTWLYFIIFMIIMMTINTRNVHHYNYQL